MAISHKAEEENKRNKMPYKTPLDRIMTQKGFLYGFVGLIAVAAATTLFGKSGFDPEIGNGSQDPWDWTLHFLRDWLQQVHHVKASYAYAHL